MGWWVLIPLISRIEKSVAVLPLVTLSGEADEYFSTAIIEVVNMEVPEPLTQKEKAELTEHTDSTA